MTTSYHPDRTVGAHRPGGPPLPATPGRVARPEYVLAAIGAGALVVGLWPLLLALRSPVPVQLPVVLAHVAGMLAGFGVIVLVGLMSRTPALELGVGADRLARWHSRGGRIVVTLVLVHAWVAVAAFEQARRESAALALWHVLRMPWLIAATIGTSLFVAVAVVSIRAARRRVSHETWHTIHLLVYVGVALGFVHQLAGPDLAGHRVIQVAWALMYTSVFALLVQHRIVTPVRNATHHRMRVHAVVREAPGVVSVIVEGHDLQRLQAQAGQFFRWRFLTPDLWKTAHPFSLSAPPTGTRLRLTVKSLGEGSSFVQRIEPGTWVLAEGPYGAMTAERRTGRDVLLVAGGVGITPMRALFESIDVLPGQDVLLLYRARTVDDLIFRAELDRLATRPGLRVQYLVGEGVGPLTPQLLHHHVPDLAGRDVYLCGPPPFATAVRRCVRMLGLPDNRLHEESFDL